jgi:hypothetical protein
MDNLTLEPYLEKLVEAGLDGADIMHGHLKTLMVEFEDKVFEDTSYGEGYKDALSDIYLLTYAIAFAKGNKGE